MPDLDYICPQPVPWNDIHRALVEHREAKCPDAPLPPVPLILAGWAYSTDDDKADRWRSTLEWSQTHEASHLIPDLTESEKYRLP